MKKTLIQLFYGVAVFLIGVFMSEFFRWRTFGDLFAYGGLTYVAFILYQTPWVKKTISSIQDLLMQPAARDSGEERAAPVKPPSKLLAMFVLFVFPVLLHIVLFGILANHDPCKGNSGCMVGSLSAFFFILFTLPTLVLLIVLTSVQVLSNSYNNYRKYLKVNTFLSVSPFVVGFAGLALISVFS